MSSMHRPYFVDRNRPACILLDLDGTLADSAQVWEEVDQRFLSRYGKKADAEYLETVRSLGFAASAQYTKEYFDLSLSEEEIVLAWMELVEAAYAHELGLKPGALPFLEAMKRLQIPVVLVTACLPDLVRAFLKQHGLEGLISSCFTADEMGMDKSTTAFFEAVLQKLAYDPSMCLYVDDLQRPLEVAQQLGISVLAMEEKTSVVVNFPVISDFRELFYDPQLYLEGEAGEIYHRLVTVLHPLEDLAVAFSGGVDSSLLLYVASRSLPEGKVEGILGVSPFTPAREIRAARDFSLRYALPLLEKAFTATQMEELFPNPGDRCYHCKRMLFTRFLEATRDLGFHQLAEGSNLDDMGDYRPGLRAIAELKVLSPLREAGMGKREIRLLSAALGLPTSKMPSLACLATRLPYGEQISPERLERIDRAEEYLLDLGYHQLRVRSHGDLARIELAPEEMERFLTGGEIRQVHMKLKSLGFHYVTLDLGGYKMGSMNLGVDNNE